MSDREFPRSGGPDVGDVSGGRGVDPVSGARGISLVAAREMRERARSGVFKVSTVLLLLGAIALGTFPHVGVSRPHVYRVGIVGDAPAGFDAGVRATATTLNSRVTIKRFSDTAAAEAALNEKHLDVIMVESHELVWRKEADSTLGSLLVGAVAQAEVVARAKALGLTESQALQLLQPPSLGTRVLQPASPRKDDRQAMALIGVILLLMAISIYGAFVLMGVIEEKSSRVVEVLLSRLRAYQLLAGKIIGIGALALGQFLLFTFAVLVSTNVTGNINLPPAGAATIGSILMWFILGFALFAMAYGTMGALVSRMEDAQSISTPISLLLMSGYILSFMAMEEPSGATARVASFVPFTAPLVVPVRVAVGQVPIWEVLIAVAITCATIYGLMRLAGRIYTGALLRTGGRMKLREAWRASAASGPKPVGPNRSR